MSSMNAIQILSNSTFRGGFFHVYHFTLEEQFISEAGLAFGKKMGDLIVISDEFRIRVKIIRNSTESVEFRIQIWGRI